MDALQAMLAYTFRDPTLLSTALNHSSYANERRGHSEKSNERLEFLGDSVLGFVVANYLYQNFPDFPEGRMTRLRAELVCEQSLYTVAEQIHLGRYMKLGKGEERTGGRARPSILADAVEAVIAALYLDGGIEAARTFIETYILHDLEDGIEQCRTDYKTTLQELVQRESGQVLSYEMIGESGPEHNKLFTAQVTLNGTVVGAGEGHTKKAAEQAAAKCALETLPQ
ncbi:MAG: ribonuclease III [Oscillospiraceae bacterium]|jgi:ribonuclease-3